MQLLLEPEVIKQLNQILKRKEKTVNANLIHENNILEIKTFIFALTKIKKCEVKLSRGHFAYI